jgi:Fe-S cluster assembly iron-binding protein IscA
VTVSLDAASGTDLNALDAKGGALLAGLTVADAGIRPTSAPDAAGGPIITLSEGAAKQLKASLGKDDVAWISVEREGPTGFTYHLAARSRSELPPEAEITRTSSRDVAVVIDAKSVPLVRGATVEWVEGQGFRFDNPNAAASR